MQRLIFDAPVDTFRIVLAGDSHEGSVAQHTKGIGKLISYIQSDPNIYWAHMGDWVEAISTEDSRYESEGNKDPIPLKQAYAAIETFRPIADKCICGLIGNHEKKLHRYGNLVRDVICRELKIPYGTYTARVVVQHGGKFLFRLYLWHGPAKGQITSRAKDPEQRKANIMAALKERLKYQWGDAAIMAIGHIHRLITVPPVVQLYLRDAPSGPKQGYTTGTQTGDYIHPDQRWYCATGCFLRLQVDGIDTYGSLFGYNPTELGFVVIHIEQGKIKTIEEVVV